MSRRDSVSSSSRNTPQPSSRRITTQSSTSSGSGSTLSSLTTQESPRSLRQPPSPGFSSPPLRQGGSLPPTSNCPPTPPMTHPGPLQDSDSPTDEFLIDKSILVGPDDHDPDDGLLGHHKCRQDCGLLWVQDLSPLAYMVKLGKVAPGTVKAIDQPPYHEVVPQGRWYIVLRGKSVGIYNNWYDPTQYSLTPFLTLAKGRGWYCCQLYKWFSPPSNGFRVVGVQEVRGCTPQWPGLNHACC